MMCQDMGMIAEKLIVLWPVYLGGGKAPPPAAFIPFYRLQPIGLKNVFMYSIYTPPALLALTTYGAIKQS